MLPNHAVNSWLISAYKCFLLTKLSQCKYGKKDDLSGITYSHENSTTHAHCHLPAVRFSNLDG
jgi:hypothetical protein